MEIVENTNAISRKEAISKGIKMIFHYKNRICEYCGDEFDITKQGIFYWCGCERNENN
jgi:hypothetical protein|tara:strand:- start:1296 stop:1469 length:174 start_codon:yes stop_codon:yes gene_type:complete